MMPSDDRWTRLADATLHALSFHAGHERKGAVTPYAAHLLGVASIVLEHGGDEDLAIAGVLQTMGHVGPEREALRVEWFGVRVARVVQECTDADAYAASKLSWRARKEAYVKRLKSADSEALLVLAADKLRSARAIVTDLRARGPSTLSQIPGGMDGALWYYKLLSETFARWLPGTLANNLAVAVQEMEDLVVEYSRRLHR